MGYTVSEPSGRIHLVKRGGVSRRNAMAISGFVKAINGKAPRKRGPNRIHRKKR